MTTSAATVGARLLTPLVSAFVSPGSLFSAASLLCALAVAVLVTAATRRRNGRRTPLRVLRRALFPRGLHRRPTTRADVGWFLFNVFAAGSLIGWAVLSQGAVAGWVRTACAGGSVPPLLHAVPGWAAATATTAALFVAYEAGYYADHWLSHHVPCLWELHKPHHTAEALTPLTNYRTHPLESLLFLNILALTMGAAAGLCAALFGPGREATVDGRNALFLAFWFTIGHLQHTRLWITFPGPLGRLFISPAHHQLHHSIDPRHHGKNLGSFLAVFDWMFGTLHRPAPTRERLTFGAEGDPGRHHGVAGGLLDPVAAAWRTLVRSSAARRETAGPALSPPRP